MKEKLQQITRAILYLCKRVIALARETHSSLQIASFLACMGILFLVFIYVVALPNRTHAILFFQNAHNSSMIAETRYIPVVKGKDARLSMYVSEVLLGPMNPNAKPLYNIGTHVNRCFIRKNAAYIDVSVDGAYPENGVTDSKTALEIFKKSVCTNFRNIDKIYMYFDGIAVYSESLIADAK